MMVDAIGSIISYRDPYDRLRGWMLYYFISKIRKKDDQWNRYSYDIQADHDFELDISWRMVPVDLMAVDLLHALVSDMDTKKRRKFISFMHQEMNWLYVIMLREHIQYMREAIEVLCSVQHGGVSSVDYYVRKLRRKVSVPAVYHSTVWKLVKGKGYRYVVILSLGAPKSGNNPLGKKEYIVKPSSVPSPSQLYLQSLSAHPYLVQVPFTFHVFFGGIFQSRHVLSVLNQYTGDLVPQFQLQISHQDLPFPPPEEGSTKRRKMTKKKSTK